LNHTVAPSGASTTIREIASSSGWWKMSPFVETR
jgi:hypothetical protein